MKVKTFTVGLQGGLDSAFAVLDKVVSESLGTKVTIHSVTDTLHGDPTKPHNPGNVGIARVIVYSD